LKHKWEKQVMKKPVSGAMMTLIAYIATLLAPDKAKAG
jgi:hypothetical protein